MTCEEVRERLPDHLLGTLMSADAEATAAHLRGCSACRAEAGSLADGLAAFARAAHDREPPDGLAVRVRRVLQAEWSAAPSARTRRRGRAAAPWMAAAAAIITLAASVGWGLSERRAAISATAEGASYTNLLQTLGGKEFRAGRLTPAVGLTLDGSVVVYDSHEDQSWAAVFVRAPGSTGQVTATLGAPDGRTIRITPIKLQPDGDGSSWIVTSADLTSFDHLTIRDAGGAVLATAEIQAA